MYLWTNIEPDIGIICACLPAMMPLVRLVRENFSWKPSLSPVFSNTHSLSKMKWPRRRSSGLVLYTDRDSFTHFGDQINPLASAWWGPMNLLPNNEAARRLEEDWPLRRVHIRRDVSVVYDPV